MMIDSLDENSVDQNQGQGDNQKDVWKVENELGHKLLGAVSLDVPMCNTDLWKKDEKLHISLGLKEGLGQVKSHNTNASDSIGTPALLML